MISQIKSELKEFREIELSLNDETSKIYKRGRNWNMTYGGRDELQFYQLQDVIEFLEFLERVDVEINIS